MFELAIGIGVLVSLFFLETFGVAAGGIVVAGYVALFLHQPVTILATLAISFTVLFTIKALSQVMFIYGRRRMVIAILLGFILGWVVRYYGLFGHIPTSYTVSVIGFIIPGLIGNSMARQGVIKTMSVMVIAAVCVRFIVILVSGGEIIA